LDSQFAIVETILTGILDFAPKLRPKKTLIVGLVCIVGFIAGLPLTTEVSGMIIFNLKCYANVSYYYFKGGGYLLDLLDYYAAGWPYLFIGLTELVIVSYVYGIQNFLDDLYHICKFNPGMWGKAHFMVLYMTLSPLIIFVSQNHS
jgi:SNF family Na+-dependent transporter